MSIQLQKRLFTVEEYNRMAEAGILGEDDRVELIDGEIIQMSPIGRRHAGCVNRLNRILAVRVGDRAVVAVQNPVQLSDRSEPQPDVALLIPRADFYSQAHPQPQEVLLIVEVANTTAEYDREVKVPLYAQANISEVWVVDLVGELVEVYRQPSLDGYAEVQQLRRGENFSTHAFPDVLLTVDEILG